MNKAAAFQGSGLYVRLATKAEKIRLPREEARGPALNTDTTKEIGRL